MYRCIRAAYPQCKVSVVCGTQVAPLLEGHPLIDHLLVYDKQSGIVSGTLEPEYDHVADLQGNRHSARILRQTRGPVATIDKENLKKWLMVNGKFSVSPCRHRMEAYFSCAPKGVCYDGLGLDLPLPPEGWQIPDGPDTGSNYSVLIPGAAHRTKAIPVEVAKEIIPRLTGPVIILGGASETEVGSMLEQAFPKNVLSLCGKLNLRDSARVIAGASQVIGGDTGLSHIAAAYDRNLDLLWGSSVPEFGMGPVYSKESKARFRQFEVPNLGCRPCSKLGFSSCPYSHFRCMQENPARFMQKT